MPDRVIDAPIPADLKDRHSLLRKWIYGPITEHDPMPRESSYRNELALIERIARTEHVATMVVRFFEAVRDRYSEFREDPVIESAVAISQMNYAELRRTTDFSTADIKANTLAVVYLLKRLEESRAAQPVGTAKPESEKEENE